MDAFKMGSRVVRVGGARDRGFITGVVHESDLLYKVRWDDGSESTCAPARLAIAEIENPPGWVPHCGDRVRVLVKDQTGRSAYVVNTENPARVFVGLLARGGAVAGPYAPTDLELVAPAMPGPQEAGPTGGVDGGPHGP